MYSQAALENVFLVLFMTLTALYCSQMNCGVALAENRIPFSKRVNLFLHNLVQYLCKIDLLQQIYLNTDSDHTERFYLPLLYVFSPKPVKKTVLSQMMEMYQ